MQFSPFDKPEKILEKTKRYLISRHPTFACSVTGEIFDYRRCHIVEFTDNTGRVRQDLISHAGYELVEKAAPGKLRILKAEELI